MNKKWFATFCCFVMAISIACVSLVTFYMGFDDGYNSYKPMVIEKIVQVPIETIINAGKVEQVIKEVPVPYEVIKIEYIYKPANHFDNVTELKNVLGGITILPGERWDCDDMAYKLQEVLYARGYYSSVQYILIPAYYQYHMRNSVKVGNDLYFIEPQTMKFWKETGLD